MKKKTLYQHAGELVIQERQVFLPERIDFLPKQIYNWEKEKNDGRKKGTYEKL